MKKIKRYLEYFDKENKKWVRVEGEGYNDEAMRIFDYISAELEIGCLIEEMNIRLKEEREDEN